MIRSILQQHQLVLDPALEALPALVVVQFAILFVIRELTNFSDSGTVPVGNDVQRRNLRAIA